MTAHSLKIDGAQMSENIEMSNKELGQKLMAARKVAQVTQLHIAHRLGLARSTISMIENGSREVRPKELAAFATEYGVDVSTLLPSQSTS